MLSLVGIKQSVYVHRLLSCSRPPSLFPDNELPDYIMVMLVNSKTLLQLYSDLRLLRMCNKFNAIYFKQLHNQVICSKT